jgi:hypothetical protein
MHCAEKSELRVSKSLWSEPGFTEKHGRGMVCGEVRARTIARLFEGWPDDAEEPDLCLSLKGVSGFLQLLQLPGEIDT